MKKLYIDLGGTYLRSELQNGVERLHETVASQTVPLRAYLDAKLAAEPEIGFVGIAYAGQVNEGVILSAPNIAVDEKNIKAAVEARHGIALEIENDLNCAVMAEAQARNADSIATLSVGTGLGAAVIDGGRLVRGGRNLAFELGHVPYKKAPFACGCGRDNCVELFASGSGMAGWLRHFGSGRSADLQAFRESDIEYERRIAAAFEAALLYAAGTLVTLANPDLLILGGGIVRQNPYLEEFLRERLEEWALPQALRRLRIETSRLENAPLEGAKLLEEKRYG